MSRLDGVSILAAAPAFAKCTKFFPSVYRDLWKGPLTSLAIRRYAYIANTGCVTGRGDGTSITVTLSFALANRNTVRMSNEVLSGEMRGLL